MTSRLDRLLTLLDTGSSSSVRATAARQIAQIAVKAVRHDVSSEDTVDVDDSPHKPDPRHETDSDGWGEVMAVVTKLLPFLRSKNFDTRTAASQAISHICQLLPAWSPHLSDGKSSLSPSRFVSPPEFSPFSVSQLVQSGSLLLASSGKEFTKPSTLETPADVARAQRTVMADLGLGFLDSVEEDDSDAGWRKDIMEETAKQESGDGDIKMEDSPFTNGHSVKEEMDEVESKAFTNLSIKVDDASLQSPSCMRSPSAPPEVSTPSAELPDDTSGLSVRELNRLKRKRKHGASAVVMASSPSTSTQAPRSAAGPPPSKVRVVNTNGGPRATPVQDRTTPTGPGPSSDKVVIDPTKGGQVEAKSNVSQSTVLEVQEGHWVWDGLVQLLQVDLFNQAWQVRHGAALALREVIKIQGSSGGMRSNCTTEENDWFHEKWCNDISAKFLCVFVLDRFCDFVSDQMVAPVRETVSQTLASLLLHMPSRSVSHVHNVLLDMIMHAAPSGGKGRAGKGRDHGWEVRHAGLLGIKYEVAVRTDLVEKEEDGKMGMLGGIVDAALMGLKDADDDVRSVAASCLIPVTKVVVERLPDQLSGIMSMLWSCLRDMKDDLGSSVGAVMELLGQLVTYDKVTSILSDPNESLSLSELAPVLFPFFRHTIPSVRLAVVKTLHTFLGTPSLSTGWITPPFLRLLFQNLILEERADIRDESAITWNQAVAILSSIGELEAIAPLIRDWYELAMNLIGAPFDTTKIYRPSSGAMEEGHNVDKSMLEQDLSLVSEETVLKGKIAAAKALAILLALWPKETQYETFQYLLIFYTDSPSALHKFLVPTIVQEWAEESDTLLGTGNLLDSSPLASEMHASFLKYLESGPPPDYHEMFVSLAKIAADSRTLLSSFANEGKIPQTKIPQLPAQLDGSPDSFTLAKASEVVGPIFDSLKTALPKSKKKEIAAFEERKQLVVRGIARYKEDKERFDTRLAAAIAAAVIALRRMPGRLNPVIQSAMNGVKSEENLDLQTRFSRSIASFVAFYVAPGTPRNKPVDKIINNLCAFTCQDVTIAPLFSASRSVRAGILSSKRAAPAPVTKGAKDAKEEIEDPDKAAAKLRRRGASLSLIALAEKFGASLFDQLEQLWECMSLSLTQNYSNGTTTEADAKMESNDSTGQNLVDACTLIQAVVPHIDPSLYPRIAELFPSILLAVTSRFALIRLLASQCMATLCDVITTEAMLHIVEHAVLLLGDLTVLANRQGSMELISHVVQKLDIKALPYVVFFVVHVLGRMSDPDDDIRFLATNTFASLVKMVPLEAGLPDPPGFSAELLQRRDMEREFLTQLLDGNKVEPYVIPIPIKAELRKYQQDGVNWLAFLAKYQLHGILCDDMGLGKTLQAICILASKRFERSERYKATGSPDSAPLPALIICPPTLTGHWFYEILKYAEGIKPILYTSSSRERAKLLASLPQHDVVITSYDTVRNDIDSLAKINWHYCILDEGHIIKNAKTKLSKAVKSIKAHHRLILSGTPIQNNVFELWSLFDFLMPGFLGTESSFNERFAKPIIATRDGKATAKSKEAAVLALEALHKQVLPFLLRRLKEDVLQDLPPKIIQDYYCDLSDVQKQLYDEFDNSRAKHDIEDVVVQGKHGEGQKHVFQSLQYLRKVCNHPALVLKDKLPSSWDIKDAPKLQALRQLLLECGIGGDASADDSPKPFAESDPTLSQHRVLIFCQMKQMLDIIENDLFRAYMPSVTYMRLDGSTDPSKRHAIVQTFNSDPSIDCLLLTTHVGGLGLTLTGADTVIFVEHDWNPMKDLQAMDRAHRLGQKKVVNVYRLITRGTLEEKIMGLQRFKLNISNSVITQQNSGLASMETDLVLDLFKRTSDEDAVAARAKEKAKESSGPVSQKNVLEGLEDLPHEEEYAGLDLSVFMGSIQRSS